MGKWALLICLWQKDSEEKNDQARLESQRKVKRFQVASTACYSLVIFSQKHKIISLANTSFIQHFPYSRSLIHPFLFNKIYFNLWKLLTSEARLTFNAKAKAKIITAQKHSKTPERCKAKIEMPRAVSSARQLSSCEHSSRSLVPTLIGALSKFTLISSIKIRPRAYHTPRFTACSFNDIHVISYSNINIYIYI